MQNTSDLIKKIAVFDFDGTVISPGLLFSAYLLHKIICPQLHARLSLCGGGARYKLHLPQRQEEARRLVVGAHAV